MKFWIKKENDMMPSSDWLDSYIISINRDTGSTLFSNLPKVWYHLGQMALKPIYEDLYIISLSIFGLDKRVSRRLFDDCWTREMTVSIPVLQYEKLKPSEILWISMLSFLTGDHWEINFRLTDVVCSHREKTSQNKLDISFCDCVSLFSGGLDSFCGAIHLLESGSSPCLIGHNEYPKLRLVQEEFCQDFANLYPSQSPVFISFTAGARAPYSNPLGTLSKTENTSRGRSLLFLCAALTIAGIIGSNIPVYIPENGFIGLNVPLTSGRKGSCSTRTTHPFFLSQFKQILKLVGIHNPIENFFAFNSKREIVQMVKDTPAFQHNFNRTISCSHPCVARYNRSSNRKYPINCGYCYPCIIRKSSLLDILDTGDYTMNANPSTFLQLYSESDRASDLNAVVNSVYRFQRSNDLVLKQLIHQTGKLSTEEVDKFLRIYKSTMADIIELFKRDPGMERYIKWDIS